MKPTRAGTPLRLKAALFALSIAAMATQAGSAPPPLRVANTPPAAYSTAAGGSVPAGRELAASLAGVLRGRPVSGSWALLLAGLTGILAIGRRRMSALGGLSLDPQRLRPR